MSRLDHAGIVASLSTAIGAKADPDGVVDLVADGRGLICVAANPAELPAAVSRLKPLMGYRWLAINSADLFGTNPVTLGTKIGIMDASGRVLKAADLPRAK